MSPGFRFSLEIFVHLLLRFTETTDGYNFICFNVIIVRIRWITTVHDVMNNMNKVNKELNLKKMVFSLRGIDLFSSISHKEILTN